MISFTADRVPLWCSQLSFICSPYKDTVGMSEYIGPSDLMIMNNKLERIYKESVWPNLKHYLEICQGGLKKITKNSS